MAAGTAAALVPIRSITRRFEPSDPASISSAAKGHSRVSADKGGEKVAYIDEAQEDAGPICLKLLAQLKGIQLGKVKDEFGWNQRVSAQDGIKVAGEVEQRNGNGQTVDQMD